MGPFLDAERHAEHRTHNLLHSVLMIGGIGLLMLISSYLIASWAGVVVAALSVALLAFFGPRVKPDAVMRIYRARPVDQRHGAQLLRIVEVLSDRAELPTTPRLFVVPSATLNAFASGTPERAVIAVTEGLLRRLSLREVAGVIAHEMSHIRNRDLAVMGLADAMTRYTQMLAYVAIFMAILNGPAWLLGVPIFPWAAIALLYLAPAVSSLLQLALSRTREFDADLEAAGLTGDPVGLASALGSLERLQGNFWEDLMLPPTRRVPYPSLLRSHPDTGDRIARLTDLARHALARPMSYPEEPMFTLVGLGPGEMTPRHRWPGLWY